MTAIVNATLVMRDHLIEDGAVLMEDGKILAFGADVQIPEGCEKIDAGGLYVGPGLVDIHTHAGGDHWFYEAPLEAAKHHLRHGTTTVLATLYFNMTDRELVENTRIIQQAMTHPEGANIAGFYTEAPYMNPKFGCDRENNPWKGPIRREEYMPIWSRWAQMPRSG